MEQRNQQTAGTPGALMRLCCDRRFPEAIAAKYLRTGKRYSTTPRMVLRGKAGNFFSFRAHVLVSIPLRMMNRYFLQNTVTFRREAVSAPVFLHAAHGHLESFGDRTMQRIFFMDREYAATLPEVSSGMTLPGLLRKTYAAGVRQQPSMSEQSPGALDRNTIEALLHKGGSGGGGKRVFTFPAPFLRGLHRIFPDRILTRRWTPGEDMNMQHIASTVTPVNRAALKQGPKTVPENAQVQELFFQNTKKTEHEIEELKRVVRGTEDQIREKVARQLREIGIERNQQVDIGQITRQVYRNMERMIRFERERRGM